LASPSASPWVIEKLGRRHDRTTFSCGNVMLDDWLRLRASQYEKKDLARAYVAVRQDPILREAALDRECPGVPWLGNLPVAFSYP
jgi:hypothetical protein